MIVRVESFMIDSSLLAFMIHNFRKGRAFPMIQFILWARFRDSKYPIELRGQKSHDKFLLHRRI